MALRTRLAAALATALGASLLSGPASATVGATFHSPIQPINASQSSNWSGYNQGLLEAGHSFTSVSGGWFVPKATQHTAGEQEFSSTWIGIGGGCVNAGCTVTDATLTQERHEQDVAVDGTASY